MPQQEQSVTHDDRWFIPDFADVPQPAHALDLDVPQLAAWHLERAHELRTGAAMLRRQLLRIVGELREAQAEWYELRERYTQPGAPHPSETELDRMITLDNQLVVMDDGLRAGRERWRQIETEAQGHELAAAWGSADAQREAEAAAATDPGQLAALLGALAIEQDCLATALHVRAADIEASAKDAAGELARTAAEWSALLALSTLTDAQRARMTALDDTVTQLTRQIERGRERWRQVEQDAQGHELTAAYLRARPAQLFPQVREA